VTSRSSFDWSRVAFSFLLVANLAALSLAISLEIYPNNYQWNYDPQRFLGLILISVLMIPLQTTAEELLFRGYLFQGLGAAFKSRLAPFIKSRNSQIRVWFDFNIYHYRTIFRNDYFIRRRA
jgi:hypothetical protein